MGAPVKTTAATEIVSVLQTSEKFQVAQCPMPYQLSYEGTKRRKAERNNPRKLPGQLERLSRIHTNDMLCLRLAFPASASFKQ